MAENLSNPEGGVEEESLLNLLIEACEEVLEPEAAAELQGLDFEDALGFAFTLLIEAGEDPEEFLREKGLLE